MEKYKDISTIDPKYWGKCGWIFLNSIALTYDEAYKEKYKQFILALPYILPCKKCGEHLKNSINKIENIDTILKNKEIFMNWLLDVRNNICKEQNKDLKTIDDELNEIYNKNENNEIKYIVITLIILVFIYFMYFFYYRRI